VASIRGQIGRFALQFVPHQQDRHEAQR